MVRLSFALALCVAIVLTLLGCNSTPAVITLTAISQGDCDTKAYAAPAYDAASQHHQLCLYGTQQPPAHWVWAKDGSRLAFAQIDETVKLPALGGRQGYVRPPALRWYVVGASGGPATHLVIADNLGLSFSPDGQYAQVHHNCYYEVCHSEVFRITGEQKICEYETRALWYVRSQTSETVCPRLPMKDGTVWDIEREFVYLHPQLT